jgi:hypothetical protein
MNDATTKRTHSCGSGRREFTRRTPVARARPSSSGGDRQRAAQERGEEKRQLDDPEQAHEERRARQLVDLVRDRDLREARPEQRDVSGPEEEAEIPMPPERPDVDDGPAEDSADAARNGRRRP